MRVCERPKPPPQKRKGGLLMKEYEGEIKFCTTCGKDMALKKVAYYERYTGEPVHFVECPSGICEHSGVKHDYKKDNFFSHPYCTKCGGRKPYYYYY